jgi:hypothetical protein
MYFEVVSRNSHKILIVLLPYHDQQLAWKVLVNYIKSERSSKIMKLVWISSFELLANTIAANLQIRHAFFSKEKLYASTFPLVLCLHFFKYSTYYRTVYYTISILLYKVKAGEKVPQHTSKAQQVSRPDIILGLILSLIFGHTSAFRPVRFRVLGPNKIRSRILFYIYFVVIFEK